MKGYQVKASELIETIGVIQREANQKYKEYKDAQVHIAELKQMLYASLEESGLKSAKGNNFSAAIVAKRKIDITSEVSVIEWLKNTPDVEYDAYIGLKTTAFKQFAEKWSTQTGEIIDGTDVGTTDSITIRANKRK